MDNILEVENLKKYFNTPRGTLHAVDDVSFSIRRGETLGVVGESGCGKSTLGRTILHLLDSTSGVIRFEGQDITRVNRKELFELRKQMQIIFQDPFSSLDPRMTVQNLIAEPLINIGMPKQERRQRVAELMDTCGLPARLADAYPHELDGGRRQRIGVARALAIKPKFIVCDEPVSALDVSIQAQVINLLLDLQQDLGLTYMFISHDLSVVKYLSHKIMVMYLGQCVEFSVSEDLFKNPLHPYTVALLAAVPVPKSHQEKKEILLGEISSPIDPKPGCRFANRCPKKCERCLKEQPALREIEPDHYVACHCL